MQQEFSQWTSNTVGFCPGKGVLHILIISFTVKHLFEKPNL